MSPTPLSQTRFKRLSSLCGLACIAAAVVLPIVTTASWAVGDAASIVETSILRGDVARYFPDGVLPVQRFAGAVVTLIPGLIFSYGLLRAGQALAAFSRGLFFSREVQSHLTAYAACMFFTAVGAFLEEPLLSVAVTMSNPPGHRLLSVGVSSTQILWLISAAVLWLITRVAAQGSALARENEQFV